MGRHRLVILEMTFMKHWGTIINFVLFAFICLIICIAVWMLSGDIQNWMKLVIYAITFAILFPLIRYIKRIRVKKRSRRIITSLVLILKIKSNLALRLKRHKRWEWRLQRNIFQGIRCWCAPMKTDIMEQVIFMFISY